MPVYEYLCGKCGHEFEVTQRITADPIKTCPKCKARKVERLISNTAFQLKGTGWYITDYQRKGQKDPDSAPASTASSTSETKTETKAETKSEAKAEAKPAKSKDKKKAAA